MPVVPMFRTPLETFQQAVPELAGAQAGTQIAHGILSNIAQRTQNRFLAPALQEQLKQSHLATQMAQMKQQYYPQVTEAEIAQKEATGELTAEQAERMRQEMPYYAPTMHEKLLQEQFKRKHPLLSLTGPAAQLGALSYMQQHPEQFGGQPTQQPPEQPVQTPTGAPIEHPAGMRDPTAPLTGPQPESHMQMGGQQREFHTQFPQATEIQAGITPSQLHDTDVVGLTPEGQKVRDEMKGILSQRGGQPGGLTAQGNMIDQMRKSIFGGQNKQEAMTAYYTKRKQAYNFMLLPVDQKSSLLAQANGIGYDTQDAAKLYINGYNTRDLALAKGLDPNNLPSKLYPGTRAARTQMQMRNQSLAEINTIGDKITASLGPYSRRVMGFSPQQIVDAIRGRNKDGQARFLAATALVPELSAMRSRAAGANRFGIETMREITTASMNKVKTLQPFISPDVYKLANQYIDTWLNQGMNAANKTIDMGNKEIEREQKQIAARQQEQLQEVRQTVAGVPQAQIGAPTDMVRIRRPDGQIGKIPRANLEKAKEAGYVEVQ